MSNGIRRGNRPLRMVVLVAVSALCAAALLSCSASSAPPPSTPSQPTQQPPTTPATPTTPTTPTTQAPGETPSPDPGTVEWNPDGVVTPGEYENDIDLGAYRLFWSSTEDTIRMAMQADTQGWVAIGFQPGRRMREADIIFGMMAGGSPVVTDEYSTGDFGPHRADVQQGGTEDVLSFGGLRTGSMTTFEFERRLDTGDALDVTLERGVPMQVIWAYGSSDNESMQHSRRGYAEFIP